MSVDFAIAREHMVDSQIRPSDVTDLALIDALRKAPRESLVSPDKAALAYADAELNYAPGLFLMPPRDVAKLLQAIRPRAGETALAIAAPYAALVLEIMGLKVTQAAPDAVVSRRGGYDVIVSEGAVSEVPEAWVKALAVGGRMGLVQRQGPIGRALLVSRSEAGAGSRPVFDAAPRFLPGFAPRPAFIF
ncbi:MAG: protein-L-isoaspartate O-methyltransferase [Alphaproteobacteria bacterium]|nr:protein-L-isoaspartate O-methyltransferase [Alphaproteobacteria bacterium]